MKTDYSFWIGIILVSTAVLLLESCSFYKLYIYSAECNPECISYRTSIDNLDYIGTIIYLTKNTKDLLKKHENEITDGNFKNIYNQENISKLKYGDVYMSIFFHLKDDLRIKKNQIEIFYNGQHIKSKLHGKRVLKNGVNRVQLKYHIDNYYLDDDTINISILSPQKNEKMVDITMLADESCILDYKNKNQPYSRLREMENTWGIVVDNSSFNYTVAKWRSAYLKNSYCVKTLDSIRMKNRE